MVIKTEIITRGRSRTLAVIDAQLDKLFGSNRIPYLKSGC